ncbi:MAG: outer membrane protein transport protein [Alphaproteobacteria bacterium]|nr:outer membrane protein transport protein [Alphaproteobacteria bacterium]
MPAAAAPLTATGAFADTNGSAALDLPASLEAGVRWQAREDVALFAVVRWLDWSRLEALRVRFDNPAQPDAVDELNYEDAWRFGIGADWAVSPRWTLRAGFAYDTSPTQTEFRSARIPDNDRQIYALGASWTPDPRWQIDIAYNRVTLDDTAFDQTGDFGDRVRGTVQGHADVLSIGATWRF